MVFRCLRQSTLVLSVCLLLALSKPSRPHQEKTVLDIFPDTYPNLLIVANHVRYTVPYQSSLGGAGGNRTHVQDIFRLTSYNNIYYSTTYWGTCLGR